ncbi:class I SAM-dependent DNA methyltransferase [Ilyomonas limi]|uniref:site-specific DNA-methyltransferase (adenine-specific) n=1 Tax=Ilyomonas limi TaxID=2575867 RepID=A0A4U3KZH5_9BACT|nr:DNA methyltransferase [Ilyomonas limi]TKK68068.1 class I SAM-dependent DNA methyltransferase [Ilyomonas limi]
MNSGEIEKKLSELVTSLNKEEFIYDFLLAYGISKTSVTRLKKGDYNLSKVEGEVLYKNKLFFKVEQTDRLLIEAEESAKEERILKQHPRFVIITDFETIVAKDLKTRLNRDFKIAELPKYYDFFLPLTGAEIYKSSNDNKADRDAAYKLAQLYDNLVTDNSDLYKEGSHKLNIFLSRLLFCFFAEDTGIFEKESVFTEILVQHTAEDGSNVHLFLNDLFRKLNSKEGNFPAYLEQFPYVNGGLFNAEINAPKFSARSRKILVECGDLDWSEINPDIFGSMIQAVADPEERSDLGMHYTSVPNIKKLIEPLFLNELYDDFQKSYDSPNNLKKLINRIVGIKFFDPACGSGNFLIITYKEIRLLEIKIIQRLIELKKGGEQLALFFTSISLSQFYGIEIKDFPHEMALLSLWLAEHQMNKVFDEMLEGYGQSKPILPLKEAGKIVCGNAARIDWEEACPKSLDDEIYILGNPPYLGSRVQDEIQKSDMDFVFSHLKKYRDLDYIACWFYKAKDYIKGFNAKFAFVSTNSITQGQQVALLWPQLISDDIEIDFAHHSFKWTNNAKGNAGVSVIIIGLRNKSTAPKYLFSEKIKKEAKNINPYLLDASNIIINERSKSLSGLPEMQKGSQPTDGGNLLLNEGETKELLSQFPILEKVIKPFYGAEEFINGEKKFCLWIGNDDIRHISEIPAIRKRLLAIKELRSNSTKIATKKLAAFPHRFGEIRYKPTDSIFVPATSSEKRKYIPIGFLNKNSIISNSSMAIYNAQPWLFAVITSRMHMVWVNAVGGKLKTDYRYSAKLCYNTFPFPDISEKQKETINQYVFQVLDERAKYPEKTMAWLYNPETMPAGLKLAHKELDEAIERIYRLNPFQNDAERLEYLFKLYEEMTKKNTLFAKEKKKGKKKVQ